VYTIVIAISLCFFQVPNGTWGEPWNKHPISSEEVQGKMFDGGELTNKMRWWRAQATSYLLRFPSEYLCTLCNRERNQAYGRKVRLSSGSREKTNELIGVLVHAVQSRAEPGLRQKGEVKLRV
jgi:hypothetical protein